MHEGFRTHSKPCADYSNVICPRYCIRGWTWARSRGRSGERTVSYIFSRHIWCWEHGWRTRIWCNASGYSFIACWAGCWDGTLRSGLRYWVLPAKLPMRKAWSRPEAVTWHKLH